MNTQIQFFFAQSEQLIEIIIDECQLRKENQQRNEE